MVNCSIIGKLRELLELGPSKREQERARLLAYQQRAQIETIMFLKLLQTMAETYMKCGLYPWYYDYGGWNPGPTVGACQTAELYGVTVGIDTQPIYKIHHETRRSLPNYYNIQVCKYASKFEELYHKRCFVPNDQIKYVDAVFELTRFGSNGISQETRQNLLELRDITQKNPVIWSNYDEAPAICYLQQLLQQRR